MSDNRVRIWFSLFVLAVFCVGLAGGVLIGRRMDRPFERGERDRRFGPGMMREGRGDGPGRGPVPSPGRLLERLSDELELTADQKTQIEKVLIDNRSRVESFQRDVRSRFEAEQRTLRDEIRKVLTPPQQEKFDRFEKEGHGPFGGRRGPPPR